MRARFAPAIAVVTAAIAWVLAWSVPAAAYAPPPLTGRVVDPAGALKGAELRIGDDLAKVAERRGYDIVVYLPPSLEGGSIEDVAYTAFNTWHVGQRGKDTGILVVIAIPERKIRIETGKGAGGAVTDLESKAIIDKMAPLLAAGKPTDAADLAISELERLLVKDGATVTHRRSSSSTPWPWIIGGLVLVLVLILIAKLGGRRGGSTAWTMFQIMGKVLEIASSKSSKKGSESRSAYKGGGGKSGGGGASGRF